MAPPYGGGRVGRTVAVAVTPPAVSRTATCFSYRFCRERERERMREESDVC